jgi:rfaE bifunctional protein kinase chain/domain
VKLTENQIQNIIQSFAGKRVLIVGDVMLDSYWWGKVERISPEAPVPIVQIQKREFRLGGAANVALNLKRLGAEPILCSLVGEDMEAEVLLQKLTNEGLPTKGILYDKERPTTVKTRVIGNKNQLLRIDSEDDKQLSIEMEGRLAASVIHLLADADAVIIEDYDKGAISPRLIKTIVEAASSRNVPTVVDPKKRNFLQYNGVTLFKPNLRELAEGLKLDLDGQSPIEEIRDAANALIQRMGVGIALITLSERGVFITNGKEDYLIPAHIRSIYDVSGAGDTVVSVAALALCCGQPIRNVAALANLAGGLVCEKVGVVPIEKEELLREAIKAFAMAPA